MKLCSKCQQFKPPTEFYRDRRGKDGLFARCKACHNRATTDWGARNPQALAAYKETYRATPNYKRLQRAAKVRYRQSEEARQKDAARWALNQALRSGKLTRQPCETCGAGRAEAHHDDYSKPLTVRWLCTKHHKQLHKKSKNKEAA